jgi:hypothetical protein
MLRDIKQICKNLSRQQTATKAKEKKRAFSLLPKSLNKICRSLKLKFIVAGRGKVSGAC